MPKTPLEELGEFVLDNRIDIAASIASGARELEKMGAPGGAKVLRTLADELNKICNKAMLETL